MIGVSPRIAEGTDNVAEGEKSKIHEPAFSEKKDNSTGSQREIVTPFLFFPNKAIGEKCFQFSKHFGFFCLWDCIAHEKAPRERALLLERQPRAWCSKIESVGFHYQDKERRTVPAEISVQDTLSYVILYKGIILYVSKPQYELVLPGI